MSLDSFLNSEVEIKEERKKVFQELIEEKNNEVKNIEEIVQMVESNGVECWHYFADLTKKEEANRLLEKFVENFGTIDGVITSAGGDISGSDKDASGGKAKNK